MTLTDSEQYALIGKTVYVAAYDSVTAHNITDVRSNPSTPWKPTLFLYDDEGHRVFTESLFGTKTEALVFLIATLENDLSNSEAEVRAAQADIERVRENLARVRKTAVAHARQLQQP